MRRGRRFRASGERGAAAVEFALVLPLLAVLVFGIIDFGRAYNAQETLTQAARVGARLQSLGKAANDATVISATKAAVSTSDVTNIRVSDPNSCNTAGTASVTVIVKADFKFLGLPFAAIHLQGTATAPC
jgi:Flp pilus assembly protein TadG